MEKHLSKTKFDEEFLAFQAQLHAYLLRIAGNVKDAEDIAHDTYLKALNKLDNFLGKSSIKNLGIHHCHQSGQGSSSGKKKMDGQLSGKCPLRCLCPSRKNRYYERNKCKKCGWYFCLKGAHQFLFYLLWLKH